MNNPEELLVKLNNCSDLADVLEDMKWVYKKRRQLLPPVHHLSEWQTFRLLCLKLLRNRRFVPTAQFAAADDALLPLNWNQELDEYRFSCFNVIFDLEIPVAIVKPARASINGKYVEQSYHILIFPGEPISASFTHHEIPTLMRLNKEFSNLDWILARRILDRLSATFIPACEDLKAFGTVKKKSSSSTPKERIKELSTVFQGLMTEEVYLSEDEEAHQDV